MVILLEEPGRYWPAWAPGPVYAKRYANRALHRRIEALIGKSKAKDEAHAMQFLASLGVRLPEVLGAWTTWRASYLVTRKLDAWGTLGQALATLPPGSMERRALWMIAGRLTAWLWQKGISHPDYYEDHVFLIDPPEVAAPILAKDLAANAGPVAPTKYLALLDVDGIRVRADGFRPSRSRRLFQAMQMLKSCDPELGTTDDRYAFLEAAFLRGRNKLDENITPELKDLAIAERRRIFLE